jgi:hypothetical protein
MKINWFNRTLLAGLLVVAVSSTMYGHSPYQPEVYFYSNVPDRPLSEFAGGKLGILQPAMDRGYLVVFYRYITGHPLSPAEQNSFLARKELHPASALQPLPSDQWKKREQELGPPQQWVKARAQFRKDKPPSRAGDDWWIYDSGDFCQDDSFLTAIRTLRDRAKKYGVQSRELQEWISAQDKVYENCAAGNSPRGVIPAELPASAGALARADRAYQIAAAHFYSDHFDEAARRFAEITKDANSPWHDVAAYMVARVALRQAMPSDLAVFDPKKLEQADRSLQEAFNQISDVRLKKSITGLIKYVALRLRPEEELNALAQHLMNGDLKDRFGQAIIDLSFLMDRMTGKTPDFPGVPLWSDEYPAKREAWRNQRFDEIRKQGTVSDLTYWLLAVEWGTPSASKHAVDRWQRRKSLPWLVAAILVTHAQDKFAGALIDAAAGVPPESPAYPTVVLHRARLLRERGDAIAARRVLDEAIQHSASWPISAINLWKEERIRSAQSIDDFVRLLPRQPLGFTNGTVTNGESEYCAADSGYTLARSVRCESGVFEGGKPLRLLLQIDDESARMLNQSAPLDLLIAIAQFKSLPENIRKQLAPAVWARAAALGRPAEAATIAGIAGTMRPELKPYIEAYRKASTIEERTFLAAFAISHFPGLRLGVNGSAPRVTRFDYADNYRDSWWCNDGLPRETPWWVHFAELPVVSAQPIAFLSDAERTRATDEFRRIVALGSADKWLSDTLISWAKTHPKDPRAPEALHFAWRAIRYGCDRKNNRSHEIFLLMHRRYPDSLWTKKTNIWWPDRDP